MTLRDSLASQSFPDWVRSVEDRVATNRTESIGLSTGTEDDTSAQVLAAGWYPELNPAPPAPTKDEEG
ncbi:hypothetical protein ACIBG8_54640 [Nonomuraea sp. NPDC050556]|uniref:hypothetical protein n=1 Tax=Nonomuraea sp. NPDC050556 TaxID=3364369 RepID=UPI0037A2CB40